MLTIVKAIKTVWPSGLRRWLKAPVRKGVGSNPTAVILESGASAVVGGKAVTVVRIDRANIGFQHSRQFGRVV